jgi:exosortase
MGEQFRRVAACEVDIAQLAIGPRRPGTQSQHGLGRDLRAAIVLPKPREASEGAESQRGLIRETNRFLPARQGGAGVLGELGSAGLDGSVDAFRLHRAPRTAGEERSQAGQVVDAGGQFRCDLARGGGGALALGQAIEPEQCFAGAANGPEPLCDACDVRFAADDGGALQLSGESRPGNAGGGSGLIGRLALEDRVGGRAGKFRVAVPRRVAQQLERGAHADARIVEQSSERAPAVAGGGGGGLGQGEHSEVEADIRVIRAQPSQGVEQFRVARQVFVGAREFGGEAQVGLALGGIAFEFLQGRPGGLSGPEPQGGGGECGAGLGVVGREGDDVFVGDQRVVRTERIERARDPPPRSDIIRDDLHRTMQGENEVAIIALLFELRGLRERVAVAPAVQERTTREVERRCARGEQDEQRQRLERALLTVGEAVPAAVPAVECFFPGERHEGNGSLREKRFGGASVGTRKLRSFFRVMNFSPSAHLPAPAASERWLWIAVAALWGVVFGRLTTVWNSSADYAHGWAVPGLCALIVWARRERAPAAAPLAGAGRGIAAIGWAMGTLLLVAALPVMEANRLWPTAQWLAAAGAGLATLAVFAFACGGAWARHFAFPIFFATTALAWPAFVQVRLVEGLAGMNAQIAAEASSLAGHPAVASGNVIEVGRGWVGVDEACAGLRSLQAVWMLAWFLGELGRFNVVRRVGLVALGLLLAFVGNAARATFLTLRVAAEGAGGNERWHEFAGNAAMVLTFAAVLLVAWVLRDKRPTSREKMGERGSALAARGLLAVTCGVVVAAEVGTRAWFGWREGNAARAQWELHAGANWKPLALAKTVPELLRFSSADSLQWGEAGDARQALAYVFRWENVGLLGTAGLGHEPTVCMPAIGARLMARPTAVRVEVDGWDVEFARYRFEAAGKTQHVFYGVWDAFHGRSISEPELDLFWRPRLQRVRDGRRRADAAQVVFVLQTENGASDAESERWLREVAPTMLRAR